MELASSHVQEEACARYEAAEGASEGKEKKGGPTEESSGHKVRKRIVCGRGKFKMLKRAMMLLRLSEPLLVRSSRLFLLLLSLSERFVCNFGSDFFLNMRYKLPRTTSLNERQRRVRFRKNNGAWQSGWCTKAVMEKRRAACNEVKESG